MDKNKPTGKKKCVKRALLLSMLAVMFCLSLCACGQTSLTGTWYSVSADPENAYDNITFQSDGTFISDVEGEYVVEGDTARLNFLGLTTVEFDIVKIDGSKALVQKGKDVPQWCEDPEVAASIYHEAYE